MADLTVNGVRLHVQRLGVGPRVAVFVHGLVMDNLSSFYFTLATPSAVNGLTNGKNSVDNLQMVTFGAMISF